MLAKLVLEEWDASALIPWAIGLAAIVIALAVVFIVRNWNNRNRRDE